MNTYNIPESNRLQLQSPKICAELGRAAFSAYDPHIWNYLLTLKLNSFVSIKIINHRFLLLYLSPWIFFSF